MDTFSLEDSRGLTGRGGQANHGPQAVWAPSSEKEEVEQTWHVRVTVRTTPKKSSMVWGNVLFGGIIGGGVDASTDAHWETVDSLTLNRNYCYGEKTTNGSEGSSG